MKVSVLSRLKKYTAMAVAGAAATTAAHYADADIVYSGLQNIAVPNTVNGLYLNIESGVFSTTATVAGFDANIWGANASTVWAQFGSNSVFDEDATMTSAVVANLSAGTLIDSATPDGYSTANLAFANATGMGWDGNPDGFWGLTTGSGNFAWIQMTGLLDGQDGLVVVDWAYDDMGNGIVAGDTGNGAIPEPGSLALVGLGAVAFMSRRRRS